MLACMLPYSTVARKFTLGRTKATYTVHIGPLDLEKSGNFICLESGNALYSMRRLCYVDDKL